MTTHIPVTSRGDSVWQVYILTPFFKVLFSATFSLMILINFYYSHRAYDGRQAGHDLTDKQYSPTAPKWEELSRSNAGNQGLLWPGDDQTSCSDKVGLRWSWQVKVSKARSDWQDPAGTLWCMAGNYTTSCTRRAPDQIPQNGDVFFQNTSTLLNPIQLEFSGTVFADCCLVVPDFYVFVYDRQRRCIFAQLNLLSFPDSFLEFLPVSLPDWCHLQVQSQNSQFSHPGHWWRTLVDPKHFQWNSFPHWITIIFYCFFQWVMCHLVVVSLRQCSLGFLIRMLMHSRYVSPTSSLSRRFITTWEQKLQWFHAFCSWEIHVT